MDEAPIADIDADVRKRALPGVVEKEIAGLQRMPGNPLPGAAAATG